MVEKLQEQIYVIPLIETRKVPRWQRGPRAVTEIRDYLAHHMKSNDIKIAQGLNEKIWERGTEKPPARIRVRAMKFEDGQVQADLA